MSAADLTAIAQQMHNLAAQIAREAPSLATMPRCDADLAALLEELVASSDARRTHFILYPSVDGVETSPAALAHWCTVLGRHDAAIAALTAFARARRVVAATSEAA